MATTVTFDDIVRLLRSGGLNFGIGTDNTVSLNIELSNGSFPVIVQFIMEKEIIVVYVNYPFKVIPDRINEIQTLISFINWGLLFSSCEYNYFKRNIRFRSTMLTDNQNFNPAQFSTVLSTCCSIADKCFPAFKAVLESGITAEEAEKLIKE